MKINVSLFAGALLGGLLLLGNTASAYVGVGIVLSERESAFFVTEVRPNSPAERSGVQIEDQIMAINAVDTAGKTLQEVADSIRGPLGTFVDLSLKRSRDQSTFGVQLERANIEEEVEDCIAGGWVNLSLRGDPRNGRISGRVGNEFVNWNVSFGNVRGYLNREYISVRMDSWGNSHTLRGYIGRTYINWRGFNGRWSLHENCIVPR